MIVENLRPAFSALDAGRVPAILATGAVVAEAFVAWSLPRPRWRTAGAIVGVGLHGVFIVAITQTLAMIAFAMMCLSLYPLYFASTPTEGRA